MNTKYVLFGPKLNIPWAKDVDRVGMLGVVPCVLRLADITNNIVSPKTQNTIAIDTFLAVWSRDLVPEMRNATLMSTYKTSSVNNHASSFLHNKSIKYKNLTIDSMSGKLSGVSHAKLVVVYGSVFLSSEIPTVSYINVKQVCYYRSADT